MSVTIGMFTEPRVLQPMSPPSVDSRPALSTRPEKFSRSWLPGDELDRAAEAGGSVQVPCRTAQHLDTLEHGGIEVREVTAAQAAHGRRTERDVIDQNRQRRAGRVARSDTANRQVIGGIAVVLQARDTGIVVLDLHQILCGQVSVSTSGYVEIGTSIVALRALLGRHHDFLELAFASCPWRLIRGMRAQRVKGCTDTASN